MHFIAFFGDSDYRHSDLKEWLAVLVSPWYMNQLVLPSPSERLLKRNSGPCRGPSGLRCGLSRCTFGTNSRGRSCTAGAWEWALQGNRSLWYSVRSWLSHDDGFLNPITRPLTARAQCRTPNTSWSLNFKEPQKRVWSAHLFYKKSLPTLPWAQA